MNKLLLIPIIIGGSAVIAGGIIFGFALSSAGKSKLETKTYDLEGEIHNIDINLTTANLEFVKSETAKVVCVDKEKDYHDVTCNNGTLTIKHVDETEWYERIFNFDLQERKVTVYLPTDNFESLNIKASTGVIKAPHDFSFATANIKVSTGNVRFDSNVTNDLNVESSTGDIDIFDANCGNIKIKASTGHIKFGTVNALEKITLNTSTGNQYLKDTTCQDLEIKSSTGSVELMRAVASNNMKIKTTTGNVRFDSADAKNIDVETDTGDITGNILTEKYFDVHSDTGKVDYPRERPSADAGECRIKTDTGNIKIRIGE